MNIYNQIAIANQYNRFQPKDEKMIEQDIKDLGGPGLKIRYRSTGGGYFTVEVWKNGNVVRRIQRRK
jgi:hypothetical protein